jgi:hypothetical protein
MADVERRRMRARATGFALAGVAIFLALVTGGWLQSAPETDVAEPVPPPAPIEVPELETPPVLPGRDETPQGPSEGEIAPAVPPGPSVGDTGAVIAGPVITEPPATEPPPTEPPVTEAPEVTTTAAPRDTTPPVLAITAPADGARLDEKVVRFAGTTEPGARVTAGKYEADVDREGSWSLVLVLFEGSNRVLFRATDEAGNEATARITVTYDKPAEEPPPGVEFTAHSTYGSCSEDPPYDIYYGTAKPGSKVTITSEYGSGNVYADGEGNWELKVYFPEAPHEVPFLVSVKDQFGHSKRFEFVSFAPI